MNKTFLVQILSDKFIDGREQGLKIMDVPGYSHFINKPNYVYLAGSQYETRYVVFAGRGNKSELLKDVKKALKNCYWQSITDFVYEYGNEPYYPLFKNKEE